MAGPEFSVIMPAYRAPDDIRLALHSAQRQRGSDLEIVVVDDGSGDHTPDVVRELAANDLRIRLIEQENAGTAAARNRAIENSRGRILALLDNDDVWLPDHLASIGAAFATTPGTGLAFADGWTFQVQSQLVYRHTVMTERPVPDGVESPAGLLAGLGAGNFVIASGAAFLREAYDAAGPFDAAISGSDDWDMWLRIAAAGYGGVRAGEEPQIVLRDSIHSQSKDLAMILRTSIAALDAALARPEPEPGALAPARRTRNAFADQLAGLEGGADPRTWHHRLRYLAGTAKRRALRRYYWRPPPARVLEALA